MFGLLVVGALVALLIYALPALRGFGERVRFAWSVPGPSMRELRGVIQSGKLLEWLAANRQRYGGVYSIWFGLDLALHVSDPELVRQIVTSNELTFKARGYNLVRPWLGNGLLTNGGDDWHQKRKMLTPAFHFRIMSTFKEPMEECCEILCARLAQVADGERTVDVYNYVTLFALDVICETAMGIKVNAQHNSTQSEFVRATQDLCHILQSQIFGTWSRIPFLFNISGQRRARDAAIAILHGETRRVIKLRREQLDELSADGQAIGADNETKDDGNDDDDAVLLGTKNRRRRVPFLDSLLLAQRDGVPLTDANIQEEVDTFMFEGHDTTSSAISFALYMLSRHADVQQRAYEETVALGPMRDANQARPYLEAVIKETLRLYPAVPSFSRETMQPFQLGDLRVPTGTTIAVLVSQIHRRPDLYAEPERFWPERFLDETETEGARSTHPFAHIAFSAGPRNCIGQRFAMLELKCTLSRLVSEFEWLPAPGFEVHPVPELILRSANGLQLRLRPRAPQKS